MRSMNRRISARTVAGSGFRLQVGDAWFHSTSRTGGSFTAALGTLRMKASAWASAAEQKDRQSAGQGQRVSGRVDLGGRRPLQKQITATNEIIAVLYSFDQSARRSTKRP